MALFSKKKEIGRLTILFEGTSRASPETWCPVGVCFGVYQREWVLTEDLELPEVET